MKKILVLQIAALGHGLLENHSIESIKGFEIKDATTVFPALTCPVQAVLRTGRPPAQNGMFFNGLYEHDLMRPFFWEQSHRLVKGPRIWEGFRQRGGRTAMLFYQQSLGEDVDFLLSPAPVHTHGGGMIDAVYSRPQNLYEDICASTGNRFRLHTYWGPLAGIKSSIFIAEATCATMERHDAPELILSYIPHLDYSLQKYGPDHRKAHKALSETIGLIDRILSCALKNGYEILVFGDYAMGKATKVLFPNRTLQRAGLFRSRNVKGRLYPDYCSSAAFAVTDHEIALIYIDQKEKTDICIRALKSIDSEITIMDREDMIKHGMAADKGPDLIITGKPGTWFAYPWWDHEREAPDFATHVDIHNKPGFDPCELFFGWHPFIISTDASKVGGTHGHNGHDRKVAWFSSLDFEAESLMDIASCLKAFLDGDG